jgi:gas vesicle protein
MSQQSHRPLDFVAGLLVGAAAGAAVGLLYAPRSGAESRHHLSEQMHAKREQATTLADESRHQGSLSLHQVKALVMQQVSRLRDALRAGKQAALETHRNLQAGGSLHVK